MLGFIKRNTKHLSDTKALTSIYNCLVRSVLEYCSVIWSPSYACHVDRLERVQNKFVKYLLFKFRFPYLNVPHETRLLLCGFQSLEARRRNAHLLFLYKLINGFIDCSSLLSLVLFLIPRRNTRQVRLFYEQYHRTNYGLNSFSHRLVYTYNRFFPDYDIFFTSLTTLKRNLIFK